MVSPTAKQNSEDLDVLVPLLASYLKDRHKSSLYELVKWLQQPQQAIFNSDALQDSVLLFRCNFLVMNALYRLRMKWRKQQLGELCISALHVQLLPAADSLHRSLCEPGNLVPNDPLEAYYLDLHHLSTGREDIEHLLQQFWKKMTRPDDRQYRASDLATLELTPPITAKKIRQQYRRLAMKHHPDRGGDGILFRKINVAFQRLKQAE